MNRFHSRFFRVLMLILAVSVLLSTAPGASAQSRQEQLDRKIAQIISQIPSNADTDAEKALYLHDYIVTNVSYELVGDHQTAYGALLDGKAVCAGYADAYQRLLTAVGIRAYTIVGTADNGDGEPFPHAWTLLYLDGKCLYTDVTWDAAGYGYDYFNLTDDEVAKDHEFDRAIYPACLPNTINYFYLNKAVVHTMDELQRFVVAHRDKERFSAKLLFDFDKALLYRSGFGQGRLRINEDQGVVEYIKT